MYKVFKNFMPKMPKYSTMNNFYQSFNVPQTNPVHNYHYVDYSKRFEYE